MWRYVSAMHRKCEENIVTEDDISEVKSEVSAFRYELLDILNKNGMDMSGIEKKDKSIKNSIQYFSNYSILCS